MSPYMRYFMQNFLFFSLLKNNNNKQLIKNNDIMNYNDKQNKNKKKTFCKHLLRIVTTMYVYICICSSCERLDVIIWSSRERERFCFFVHVM